MDLSGIISEMNLRPDMQILVEWIQSDARDIEDARDAIAAYFDAVEEL